MTTADGQYLEQFVFDPGSKVGRSKYKFPQESPAKKDWNAERLVQLLLARLYSHQGQTSHPSGSMDNSNPHEMDIVL
jgi:hypothetical protein